MKRKIIIVLSMTAFLVQQTYAIGISPARMTYDIREYNCTFGSNIGYTLTRPGSGRYSMFSVYDAVGMNGTITGCSASNSVEYIDSKNMLIDWGSAELSSASNITAAINIQSPQSWACPVEPGGYGYFADLVRHSDVIETGTGIGVGAAVVSQIALYRNYALKGNVINLQEEYLSSTPVQFGVEVTDYLKSTGYLQWFDFSYTIDWESDGIVDKSMSRVRMTDEFGRTDGSSLAAGFKYKNLDFEHIYSAPGDYMITLNLSDIETTSLTIPIHIVPEPATLLVFGLGGLFLRNKQAFN